MPDRPRPKASALGNDGRAGRELATQADCGEEVSGTAGPRPALAKNRNLRRSVTPTAQVGAPRSGPRAGRPRHGRPPAAARPVRRWTVRRLPGRPRGPARDAHLAAPCVPALVGFTCRAGAEVARQTQEFGSYGAHLHPLRDGESGGVAAFATQCEEPGVDKPVVREDAGFAAHHPDAPGGRHVAATENDRQAGGHDHPVLGHRDTPVPVGRPQRKGARRTCATRDGSALGFSLGVHRHVLTGRARAGAG